jgi:uncharacterized protein YcbK (DUF882 family)
MFYNQTHHDTIRIDLRKDNPQLGKYFRANEFRSRDGYPIVLVHPSLIVLLNTIRRYFDKPVIVNSGYRTRSHNRAIGGARYSYHCLGMAADIWVPGVSIIDLYSLALGNNVGGIGIYNNFIHLDVGKQRLWTQTNKGVIE